MEGAIGLILVIVFGLILFGGFRFIMEKYAGTRYHGRFGASEAFRKSDQEKEELELFQKVDPNLVQRAIERCKEKNYSLTHGNILAEIRKEKNY